MTAQARDPRASGETKIATNIPTKLGISSRRLVNCFEWTELGVSPHVCFGAQEPRLRQSTHSKTPRRERWERERVRAMGLRTAPAGLTHAARTLLSRSAPRQPLARPLWLALRARVPGRESSRSLGQKPALGRARHAC